MKANKNFAARLISIFLCILLLLVFCGCINFDIPDFPKDSEGSSEDFSEESIPSPEELGLTEESDPEKVEYDLMKELPEDHWILYNMQIITFGRQICHARNPKCDRCFLTEFCLEKNR